MTDAAARFPKKKACGQRGKSESTTEKPAINSTAVLNFFLEPIANPRCAVAVQGICFSPPRASPSSRGPHRQCSRTAKVSQKTPECALPPPSRPHQRWSDRCVFPGKYQPFSSSNFWANSASVASLIRTSTGTANCPRKTVTICAVLSPISCAVAATLLW